MPDPASLRPQDGPTPRGGSIVRSLLAKLVAGTLVVLALVLVPSFLVLRHRIRAEIREAMRRELTTQARTVAAQLAPLTPQQAAARLPDIVRLIPVRVTVVDPAGKVLADSDAAPGSMDNHRERPEVRAALAEGTGSSIRHSATLEQTMIYAASRYPATGPPAGVVRLALPTARADQAAGRALDFLDTAAAGAATAAVILSLVMALYLTRGLRAIRRGAWALAEGDLTVPIAVRSRDEVGEVAAAIGALAAKLRSQLLDAGADRSTLQALMDELPVGVIVCGTDRVPRTLNGAARRLLDLPPDAELEQVGEFVARPGHAEVAQRVLATRLSEEQPLAVASVEGRPLRGRWVPVGRTDGGAELVLILWDDPKDGRQAVERDMTKWAAALQEVAADLSRPTSAARLARVIEQLDRARAAELPAADAVAPVTLSSLCEPAVRVARARAAGDRISIELELGNPETLVVEANGRAGSAVHSMFNAALSASSPGAVLRLRSQDAPTDVRLVLRVRADSVKTRWMATQVAPLGGSAGADPDGEDLDVWLRLPKA